jgi:hypothetical protein
LTTNIAFVVSNANCLENSSDNHVERNQDGNSGNSTDGGNIDGDDQGRKGKEEREVKREINQSFIKLYKYILYYEDS